MTPVFRNAVCLCCALASSVAWLRQCLEFMSRNQACFAYIVEFSTRNQLDEATRAVTKIAILVQIVHSISS